MAKRTNPVTTNKNTEAERMAESKLNRLVLFVIVFITFLVFSNAIPNGFTNWDDRTYITENNLIRNLSFDGIKAMFAAHYSGHYHPLTCLSNAIEYHFFKLNPAAYHFFNVLLHLLNVVLVFYFIIMLGGKTWIAAGCSLFFAIHPMHVESIAWVSERKDVLYAFFYLAALIFYLKYIRLLNNKEPTGNSFFKKPGAIYGIVLFLFLLSLLSKSMAVTLPAIMLLIDFFCKRKITAKTLLEKIPFFILSAVFVAVALPLQKAAVADVAFFPFPDRIFVVTHSLFYYLQKLILPTQLSCIHPFPVKDNGLLPFEYYLSAGLIVAIAIGIFFSGKYRSLLVFGVLFFLITIFPVAGIFSFGTVEVCERYTYIPYLGFFFIIGQLTVNKVLLPGIMRNVIIVILSIYTVVFMYASYQRNKVWQDSITLWSDAIEKIPSTCNGKKIELNPYYAYAYFNRGSMKNIFKDFQGAIDDNSHSIEINPSYPKAFYNRAFAKQNLNDLRGALEDYSEAIRLNPDYDKAYNNRGIVRQTMQDYRGSLEDFDKSININPNNGQTYAARGNLKFSMNEKSGACLDWQHAAGLGHEEAQALIERYCR